VTKISKAGGDAGGILDRLWLTLEIHNSGYDANPTYIRIREPIDKLISSQKKLRSCLNLSLT
jgi:hypothetical protein